MAKRKKSTLTKREEEFELLRATAALLLATFLHPNETRRIMDELGITLEDLEDIVKAATEDSPKDSDG